MQRSFIGIRTACLVILGHIKRVREGFTSNDIKNLFEKIIYELLTHTLKIISKTNDKLLETDNNYEKVKQTNTDKKTDMQDQIDEHEANRIGRGKAGTAFGLINGVGRPPEAEDNSDKVEPQNVKVLGMKNGQWEVLSEEERIPRHAFRNQQLKKGTDGQYVDPKKK
jgi:hypothetical protein